MGLNHRYIPLEIVEEIVANLPVKSILRFSTVSKSWNFIVSELGFIKRYRGREMMGLMSSTSDSLSPSSLSSFSSLSSLTPEDVTNLIRPVPGDRHLKASCDELWCFQIGTALFLCNPSMKTYRKLPDPHIRYHENEDFIYGLGYDAVSDDYKLLKCSREFESEEKESELYSLRSDSWRKISWSLPHVINLIMQEHFVFFNGMLHCIDNLVPQYARVLCFDLSTEKYGEVVVPEKYKSEVRPDCYDSEMTVLRGKLCVFLNVYHNEPGFYLWEIEESWTMKFHIDYGFQTIPTTSIYDYLKDYRLTPLYLYDNGDNLMKLTRAWTQRKILILMYKKKENIFVGGSCSQISDAVVYVETLISP